ncbi:MAG: hypothetical protein ABFS30_03955, partial [Pseudomonadota bacterium]
MDERAFLKEALSRLGLLKGGALPHYEALAGGVSSDIWRVDLPGGPICIKRALAKLRVEMDWRAPVERNAYDVHGNLVERISPLGDPADPTQHRTRWGYDDDGLLWEVNQGFVGFLAAVTSSWRRVNSTSTTSESWRHRPASTSSS